MSILFVLLTFLVIISVNHVCFRPPQSLPATQRTIHPPTPLMTRLAGFNIPKDYSFHPGHTWVLRESQDDVRVGLDASTAELIEKIDHIEIAQPERWVRQAQKLMTIYDDGFCFDLVSPG